MKSHKNSLKSWQEKEIKKGLNQAQKGQFVKQSKIDLLLGRKKPVKAK